MTAAPDPITILLADGDLLRRDGLAAVLQGTPKFEILAQCTNGEVALDRVRELRPRVAVVDLNIPGVHGIELVRRIRSENLGTKVIILSASTDDDLIREVVRAGGDAYLLKSGPARHLIDAISYVCDGGQYFSPQLRRDGLNRHLLEEAPRAPVSGSPETAKLRERLRKEGQSEDLEDRDYEILSRMADGIRPILDRLDEIEGRVNGMETGTEPVPANVRGWLSTEMTDTFGGRSGTKDVALARNTARNTQELEARLPQLIEQAVTSRFHSLAEKLQEEIEETHVRTLETFVKNIQVKLVRRVSALETDMSKQAQAMEQMREYSARTEDNLSRLISGVDRLTQELPRRLQPPAAEKEEKEEEEDRKQPASRTRFSPKVFWVAVLALLICAAAGIRIWRASAGSGAAATDPAAASSPETAVPGAAPSGKSDSGTKMQAAQTYVDHKDFAAAEDIYKQIIKANPNDVDAMKALASVLYREDKIEESAAVLDRLPR